MTAQGERGKDEDEFRGRGEVNACAGRVGRWVGGGRGVGEK